MIIPRIINGELILSVCLACSISNQIKVPFQCFLQFATLKLTEKYSRQFLTHFGHPLQQTQLCSTLYATPFRPRLIYSVTYSACVLQSQFMTFENASYIIIIVNNRSIYLYFLICAMAFYGHLLGTIKLRHSFLLCLFSCL